MWKPPLYRQAPVTIHAWWLDFTLGSFYTKSQRHVCDIAPNKMQCSGTSLQWCSKMGLQPIFNCLHWLQWEQNRIASVIGELSQRWRWRLVETGPYSVLTICNCIWYSRESKAHRTTGPIEVFVNNTNLTFLSFLYKISIELSLKKWSCLQWDLNSLHWPSLVYKSDADPTVLSRHVLNSFMHHFTFCIWIISRFNRVWLFKDLKIWNCQLISIRLINQWWSMVTSNPTGGNFIFFKTPRC